MNRIYRLVFNRALGLMQVASEVARAPRGGGAGVVGNLAGTLRPVSFGVWLALGWVGWVLPATGQQAQDGGRIVSDPNAPGSQRPTVITAPNGVPVVNITTPSRSGVSRNVYRQFDVGTEGAILNNARGDVQTQLGGWIQGNPWLATGTAKVILNEINGNDPSRLRGYLEVAGQRAEVVIANPAGILVDGAGFLNASRVTLTTGVPIVTGGALEGYRVEQGAIRVEGAGLDATQADYTDLITRSLQVNAGIWANQLQASLGTNVVSADHTGVASVAGSGDAPTFALDVGALGGMYANKIWLVGNEHGVGARNAGKIGAQAGELVVTIDGRLENVGSLQSQQDTRVAATDGIVNSGTVSAGRELQLRTDADLDNSAGTINARRIEVDASSLRNRGGAIEQTGSQQLSLHAGSVVNRDEGRIGLAASTDAPGGGQAGGNHGGGSEGGSGGEGSEGGEAGTPVPVLEAGALRIAGELDNSAGRINAAGQMDLEIDAGLDNDGGQLGVRNLALRGGNMGNREGRVVVSGAASLNAADVINDGGRLEVADALVFQARTFSNRNGSLTHSGGASTTLSVAGTLDNAEGLLRSKAGTLRIESGQFINQEGRLEHAGSLGLEIKVDALQGQGGTIVTAGGATLDAGLVDHQGAALSADHFQVNASRFDNRDGTVIATGALASALHADDTLDNSAGGLIASSGDLSLDARTLDNTDGRIEHAGEGLLSIHADALNGPRGTIAGNGTLDLRGGTTDLTDGTTVAQRIAIDTGNLTTAGGQLIATGNDALQLQVRGTLDNRGGTVATNGALQLDAGAVNNQAGTLQAAGGGDTRLTVSGVFDNRGGTLAAAGNTALTAAELHNGGGSVQAAGASTLQVTVDGLLDNSADGLLTSGGDLSLAAGTLDNTDGRIEHAGEGLLSIHADTLDGQRGTIAGNGTLDLRGETTDLTGGTTVARRIAIETGNLTTAGGQLIATGNDALHLQVRDTLDNQGGTVATNGALQLDAGTLNNRAGTVQAAGSGDTRLAVSGVLDNRDGTIAAAGNTAVTAAVLHNRGGVVQVAGASTLQVTVDGLLDNSADGLIASGGDLSVQAHTLDNTDGRIEHAGEGLLSIHADTLDGQRGTIAGNGTLDLRGETMDLTGGTTVAQRIAIETGNLTTAGGQLIATGNDALRLQVRDTLDNHGGTVATNGALQLDAGAVNNRAGVLQAAGSGDTRLTVSGMFDNTDGTTAAAGDTHLTANELRNAGGTVQAAGDAGLHIGVKGLLDNSAEGLIAAGGGLVLGAAVLDNSGGRIEHSGEGGLDINAGTLRGAGGSLVSNGALNLQGTQLDLHGATTVASHITVDAQDLITADGQLIATGNDALRLQVRGTLDNHGGTVATNGALQLDAGVVNNRAGTLQAVGSDDTRLAVTGLLDNTGGTLAAAGNTQVTAAALHNAGGSVQAAGGSTLQVTVDGLLDNSADGLIASSGDLSVDARTLDNTDGRIEHAGEGLLSIHADALNGPRGTIAGNGTLDLRGGTTDLTGGTTVAQRIAIDTGNLTTAGGQLIATGNDALQLQVRGTLDNRGGTVATNGALQLDAGAVNNQAGTLQAAGGGDTRLTVSGVFDNRGGTLAAAGNTALTAAELHNGGGSVQAAGASTLQVTVDGLLDNSADGLLTSGGDLSLAAGTLDNTDGRIEHAGEGLLSIHADTLDGQRGTIAGNGTLDLRGETTDLTGGTTVARRIAIETGNLTTAGGQLIATGNDALHLQVRDTLDNQGGTVATNGALQLDAGTLNNRAGTVQAAGSGDTRLAVSGVLDSRDGTIAAAGNTAVTAAVLHNRGGVVQVAGASTLQVTVDGLLDNSADGLIASGGDLSVQAHTLDNTDGRIEHAGEGLLSIHADTLDGQRGTIAGNGTLDLRGETMDLTGGTTVAQRIAIETGNLTTAGGQLIATGNDALRLQVRDTLDNHGGTVATNGALQLDAGAVNNRAGVLQAAGSSDTRLAVTGLLDNASGTVVAAGDAHVTAVDLVNSDGTVAINGALQLEAGTVDNRAGTLQAAGGGDTRLTVSGLLDNRDGTLAAAGNTFVTAAELRNAGGVLQAAGASTLQVTVDGLLDNSADGLLTSGGDLGVEARTLDNTEGRVEHAGEGLLSIRADTLNGHRGTIAGNGTLDLRGETTDLTGGTTVARRIAVETGNLTTAGGQLIATGNDVLRLQVRDMLDNHGGTVATNGALQLDAGTVNNRVGTLQAAGSGDTRLTVSGALDNAGGGTVVAAGNTRVTATELRNAGGTMQAAGTSTLQVTVNGLLDNSADGLLTSGGDLSLAASTLDNIEGRIEHAGEGLLSIRADTLNGQRGTIAGNGTLDLRGEVTDLTGGTTVAQRIAIETGNLTTAGGQMIATGNDALHLQVRDTLDNHGGTVATNGALQLDAGSVNNRAGTLQAAGSGDTRLAVAGLLDNTGGTLATAGNTQVTAASLRNAGGSVQAVGTSTLQVTVDDLLDNSADGLLTSGGDLSLYASTLVNTDGRIEHAGSGTLSVRADTLNGQRGTIAGNGALDLRGETTDLTSGTTVAQRIAITTGNLTTAGGQLIATGNDALHLQVRDTLDNQGGTVATNGALQLDARTVNNRAGVLQAAGNGDTRLTVSGVLDNIDGTVAAAGNTVVTATGLRNAGGSVQAAGASTLQVTVDGLLDNSADGLLASGGDLSLDASTLDNTDGRIEHAGSGTLSVRADTLNGQRGTIAGNGTLDIHGETTDLTGGTTVAKRIAIETGSLTTAGGQLIATGSDALRLQVRGTLDNHGGTVATNGALQLDAGTLNNRAGTLQAAGSGATRVSVSGAFDNRQGELTAAGRTTLAAASLDNGGGRLVSTSQAGMHLDARGALANRDGSIASNGDITLLAASLDNQAGVIETRRSIDATVGNTLDNTGGALLAGETLALRGGSILNGASGSGTAGLMSGADVALRADLLDNSGGRVGATRGLDIAAQRLLNKEGVLDGTGAVSIATAEFDNTGGRLIQRGSAERLVLDVTGAIANTAGLIGAEGEAQLTAAALRNRGGTVTAQRGLDIGVTGAVDNNKGLLQSGAGMVLNGGGAIDNTQGQVDAAGTLALSTAGLTNSGGSILAGKAGVADAGLSLDVGGTLDNRNGQIGNRGGDVSIRAATVENGGGTLVAQRDIELRTAAVNNDGGTLYASGDLRYQNAAARLDNGAGRFGAGGAAWLELAQIANGAGGRLQAGTLWLDTPAIRNDGDIAADALHINLTGLSGNGGRLYAAQWLDARYDGDFTYASQELASDGRLDLRVSGRFTNQGTLKSAGELNVTATDVINQGAIQASNATGTGVATITASGTVDNRRGASIEADNLRLSADRVVNTGDITGNVVQVDANTLTNGQDLGQALASRDYGEGFIGAADYMELRIARQLSNLDGEIFSGGDLVITGRTDGSRVQRVDNISGRIQAEGMLWLDADSVLNQRRVLLTEHRQYVGQEQLDDPDAGSSWEEGVPGDLQSRYCKTDLRSYCMHFRGYTVHESRVLEGTRVIAASAAGQLLSGGAMRLNLGRLDNLYSTVAAGGSLSINGRAAGDGSDPAQWSGVINNVALAGYKIIQRESSAEIEYQTCRQGLTCQFEPTFTSADLGSSTVRKDYVLAEGAASITAGGGVSIVGGAINNTVVQASGGGGAINIGPLGGAGSTGLGNAVRGQAGSAGAVGQASGQSVGGAGPVQSAQGHTVRGQGSAGTHGPHRVDGGGNVATRQADAVEGMAGPEAGAIGSHGPDRVSGRDGVSTRQREAVDGIAGLDASVAGKVSHGHGLEAISGGQTSSGQGPAAVAGSVQPGGNDGVHEVAGERVQGGAGPDGAAPQLVGTADRPLPGLVPADNGMFRRSADPDSPFLVSTAPRFVPKDVVGSDRLLGQLGQGDAEHKRLGDAYYEQRLVQEQLLQLTGRNSPQGGLEQYRTLMDNAAQVADALGLKLGAPLTSAQIGALDRDIVWLVEQEIDGQKVLVPVVYLSRATAEQLRAGGALIAGESVAIQSSATLSNNGTLSASQGMWLGADTLINDGTLTAGAQLSTTTTGDTINRGSIDAGSVAINAGRDFVQTASGSLAGAEGVAVVAGRDLSLQQTTVASGGNLLLGAGNDLHIAASQVQAGGDLAASAGRNLDVTAMTTQQTVGGGRNVSTHETLQNSSLQAGGSLALQAGQDLTLQAADVRAGEAMALVAGRDLNLTTVTTVDTSLTEVKGKRYSKQTESRDETVHGTVLQAGSDIALVAGRDATLTAAGVYSQDGGIALSAGRDVNLLAAQERHDLTIDEQRKKKGLFSSKTTTTHDEWHESLAVGTTLSGESVQIAAGRDLTAQGAQIAGTGDVLLAAGRDLTLTTAENTYSESHDKTVKKSGLFSGGGIGFTIGKQRTDTTADISDTTHTGTLVGSTSGRVDIVAGRDVGITGSDVLSQAGIGIVGQNVTIEAAQDSSHTVETQKFRQSGINVSLKGGAVDTAMAVKNSVDRAGQVQDDRLAALHLAQAGQTLFSGGQAGLNSLKGAGDQFDALANTTTDTKATGNNGLSLRIGIGASKSSSSVEYNATTAAGSRIASEGDVVIHATGDGKGDGGDLTVTGSRIEGDNVTLAAANDLVLKAQQETREQIERNKASSGEIGVTIGSEAGIGVYVSASAAKGKGDGNGTTHAETTVDAGNTLTLISGRDTTLEGAQAKGETVIADIGRNLTMTSQQDTNDYRRKDQSAGIDAAIGTGGGQISANYNQSRIDSTYTSVKEQTGIQAGEGGFDIRVGGHTQLDGAAIASTADPGRNRLETGSLGWSDLHNEAEYKASSIGGSVSGGSGGGSVSPNIAPPQHKDASSTTAAGIADGTLIVRDGSGEGITRGVTELQQDGLKEIFDLQKVQERMEMGQVAGQVGMRAAGDLAQKMGWEEGSKEKVILHGVVGAAIAALGGGDALSGLAGAAANQLASKAMQDYLRGNDIDPNSVEGRLLMELGSVAVGAAVGGGSGAASALAGEQFNRQLHPEERSVIEKLMKEGYSEEQLMAVACVMVQCLLGRDMIEPGTLLEGADGMSLTPAGTYLASQYQSVLDGMTAGQQEEIARALAGSGLFKYTRTDAYKDAFHDAQVAQRLGGVAQAGIGMLGAWASSGLCAVTGWGCVATVESADNIAAGLTTWYQGRPTLTLQNQAWQAIGLSPGNANLAEAITGVGIAAGGASAVNRVLATKDNASVLADIEKKIVDRAERVSTAKPEHSVVPRDLNEQVLWNQVKSDPSKGVALGGLNSDPRFPASVGFQKMQATHQLPDGKFITIHYQYNSRTGKAYDIKIVTPQRSTLQPGPSIK